MPTTTQTPLPPGGPAYPVTPDGDQSWRISQGGSLAAAQALLNSNPSALTQAQWAQLQAAGLIAGTVPYSSAGQVSTASSAIDPATGIPYATELATAQGTAVAAPTSSFDIGSMLSTTYAGLPLFLWLALGAGGFLLFSNRGGGRR